MNKSDSDALKRYFNARKYRQETGWEEEAISGLRYVMGDQWNSRDLEALLRSHRAPLVFNEILPAANSIIGHFIQTASDAVVNPADAFADPVLAKMLRVCIKQIEQVNNVTHEDIQQFWDGFMTGIGIKETYQNYDVLDDVEIKTQQKNPWNFYLDPYFQRYDYTDAHGLWRDSWMTAGHIRILYGDEIADDLPSLISEDGNEFIPSSIAPTIYGKNNDYGNKSVTIGSSPSEKRDAAYLLGFDTELNLYRVVEEYKTENIKIKYYYDPEADEGNGKWDLLDNLTDDEKELVKTTTVTRNVKRLRLTTLIGDKEIQSELLDQSEFYQLFNFFFPYFWNGKYMGVVKNLQSPQDEINKRRSSLMDILNKIAFGGYFHNDEAFTDEQEADLNINASKNVAFTKVNRLYNDEGHLNIIPKIAPQISTVYERLLDRDHQTIQHTAGTPDGFIGTDRRKESGVAKRTDIMRAAMKHDGVIENFKMSQRLQELAYIWWIQNTYTEEKVIRIYGDGFGKSDEEIVINKRAMGMIFNDISIGKYDVVIDYEAKTSTERDATKFRLIEWAKMAPLYADIFAIEALKLESIPEKDMIINMIMQRSQQQAQQNMMPGQGQGPRPNRGVRRMPQKVQGR